MCKDLPVKKNSFFITKWSLIDNPLFSSPRIARWVFPRLTSRWEATPWEEDSPPWRDYLKMSKISWRTTHSWEQVSYFKMQRLLQFFWQRGFAHTYRSCNPLQCHVFFSGALEGDTVTPVQAERMKAFHDQLSQLITGTKEFVFVMDDPTGNSYLQVGIKTFKKVSKC